MNDSGHLLSNNLERQ